MSMVSKFVESQLKMIAEAAQEEICGFVTTREDIVVVPNVAKDPRSNFVFHKRRYLQSLREVREDGEDILCFFHTHPSGISTPSKADRDFADRALFPSLIVTKNEVRKI